MIVETGRIAWVCSAPEAANNRGGIWTDAHASEYSDSWQFSSG